MTDEAVAFLSSWDFGGSAGVCGCEYCVGGIGVEFDLTGIGG